MKDVQKLREVRCFLLDMDGVMYRGSKAIPGAAEFVARLRQEGIPFQFVTNNSTTPAAKVAARLVKMGIPAQPGEVMTSSEATATALADDLPGGRVMVLGEEGIREALLEHGFKLTDDHRDAQAVIVGLDRGMTYTTLQEASLAIQRGARFLATNPDLTFPSDLGLVPGAGALVVALEAATDVKAEVIGKPSPVMFEYALARLGVPASDAAAVGDRPETDTLAGQMAGVRTIGLLSGVTTAEHFAAFQPPPDWIFADLGELGRAYFGDPA